MKTQAGFTIFELVIVLVMVGLLTAGLVPLITAQHARNMDQEEREALHQARDALIGYALTRGGFPAPSTSAADVSMRPVFPPGWDLAPPTNESYLPSNNPILGVNTFGSYRKYFWYDVRAELRRDFGATNNLRSPAQVTAGFLDLHTAPSEQGFCRNVETAMNAAVSDPRVCQLAGLQDTTRCPGGADAASAAAFTLVSFGSDMAPNMAHADINLLATPQVRNYENPARAINRTRTATHNPFYDDRVVSVFLAELVRECQTSGLLSATAAPPASQQITVGVTNSSNDDVWLRPPTGACIEIEEGQTRSNLGPFQAAAIITIHQNLSNCDNDTNRRGNTRGQPLSTLDSPPHNEVIFTCTGQGTPTCTHQ